MYGYGTLTRQTMDGTTTSKHCQILRVGSKWVKGRVTDGGVTRYFRAEKAQVILYRPVTVVTGRLSPDGWERINEPDDMPGEIAKLNRLGYTVEIDKTRGGAFDSGDEVGYIVVLRAVSK